MVAVLAALFHRDGLPRGGPPAPQFLALLSTGTVPDDDSVVVNPAGFPAGTYRRIIWLDAVGVDLDVVVGTDQSTDLFYGLINGCGGDGGPGLFAPNRGGGGGGAGGMVAASILADTAGSLTVTTGPQPSPTALVASAPVGQMSAARGGLGTLGTALGVGAGGNVDGATAVAGSAVALALYGASGGGCGASGGAFAANPGGLGEITGSNGGAANSTAPGGGGGAGTGAVGAMGAAPNGGPGANVGTATTTTAAGNTLMAELAAFDVRAVGGGGGGGGNNAGSGAAGADGGGNGGNGQGSPGPAGGPGSTGAGGGGGGGENVGAVGGAFSPARLLMFYRVA